MCVFFRIFTDLLFLDNDPPDINLLPVGFLHLARDAKEAEHLKSSWKIQVYFHSLIFYVLSFYNNF